MKETPPCPFCGHTTTRHRCGDKYHHPACDWWECGSCDIRGDSKGRIVPRHWEKA